MKLNLNFTQSSETEVRLVHPTFLWHLMEILVRVVSSYFLTEISATAMQRHEAEANLIRAGDVQ